MVKPIDLDAPRVPTIKITASECLGNISQLLGEVKEWPAGIDGDSWKLNILADISREVEAYNATRPIRATLTNVAPR